MGIGIIQGIYKWIGQEYVELDTIEKEDFMRTRRIFYAINFNREDGFYDNSDIYKNIIIDIVYDEGKKGNVLITDPQKTNGVTLQYGTDYPGEVVWVGYFDVPGYAKYSAIGKHTVTIKVAPRKWGQWARSRDFSEEVGGVTQKFTFEIED